MSLIAYNDTDRNVLTTIEVLGPLTVDEVIAIIHPSVDSVAVRAAMQRLVLCEDIVERDGLWYRSRVKP